MKLSAFLAAALAAFSTLTADAALITWGAPQGIAGDSDVSTAGTFVGALNTGGPGTATTIINGVTFTGVNLNGQTNLTSGPFTLSSAGIFGVNNSLGTGAAPFANLSAPYKVLLSSDIGPVGSYTLTLNSLTVGQTYQFQWWNSAASFPANFQSSATAGNAVTLGSNPSGVVGGLGQYALGTFVADATSQVINFSGVTNGFQLRQVAAPAVPEPGTALAGVALVGLCGTMRRRRAKL